MCVSLFIIDIYIRWNILPITAKTLSWPHTPVSHAITNCYFQQRQNHSKTVWHHLSTAPNCSCLLTLPPWLWQPDIYHLTPPTFNTNVNVSDVMQFFSHFSVMFATLLDWQNRIGACVPTWEEKIWQLGRKETKIKYFPIRYCKEKFIWICPDSFIYTSIMIVIVNLAYLQKKCKLGLCCLLR